MTDPFVNSNNQCTPVTLNPDGSLPANPLNVQFAPITASAAGATTLVPAVAGKKIRIVGFYMSGNGTVNANFQSHNTVNKVTGLLYLNANAQVDPGYFPVGIFETMPGEALDINLSTGVAVGGNLAFVLV